MIMKVVRLNKKTGEKKVVGYPRYDLKPVVGLSEDIGFYGIIEEKRPDCDYKTHTIKTIETFSGEPFEGKSYIKTFTKSYELELLSNERIIQELNNSVGSHIDINYPNWKQNKHALEIQIGTTQERIDYITNLFDWAQRCRTERDLRESELINNSDLPSFEWEAMP